jgi:putative ABC transport system permease protein
MLFAGAVAMTLGILLISPLAIRALATPGRRAPVAVRLALRDLARHQARSGAALAAISLALGITAAIIISSAVDKTAAVHQMAGSLPHSEVTALDMPVNPADKPQFGAGKPGRTAGS